MNRDKEETSRNRSAVSQSRFNTRGWILLPLLAAVALAVAVLVASSVSAIDGVAYYVGPDDNGQLGAFVAANPGKDIVVLPAEGVPPLSGEERRSRDEARAAAEDRQQSQMTTEPVLLACSEVQRSDVSLPGRFVSCGGSVLSLPSAVSTSPALTLDAKGERLAAAVRELLVGTTPAEEELGFSSSFGTPGALNSVLMNDGGDVVVDFNDTIVSDLGSLHPGFATHTMLEQLLRTVFQFDEVQTVTLTLDGSCEDMAALYGNSCFTWDRSLWNQQNVLNGVETNIVSLEGGKK